MGLSLFKQDIIKLKGVGSSRRVLFERLGAPTIGALLRLYPRRHINFGNTVTIAETILGETSCICGTVVSRMQESCIRHGLTIYSVQVCDKSSTIQVKFFNNRFACQKLKFHESYLFYGNISSGPVGRVILNPEIIKDDEQGKLRPVYPQTAGLSSKQIESAVKEALLLLPAELNDPIPEKIRKEYDICELGFCIRNIHFPGDKTGLEAACRRAVFEELLTLQLGFSLSHESSRSVNHIKINSEYLMEYEELLPFELTAAQLKVINECLDDMEHGKYTMQRLIQGDVGSGKTAVALGLCYSAINGGKACAIMAPTEILAEQHYRSMSGILKGTNITVGLITGSMPRAQKRAQKVLLKEQKIDLIIGTHALLSEDVEIPNLGLVITDEQHRFGVLQRGILVSKGKTPHVLIMSATPIPRTLAHLVYGGLDVSIIDEMPPGRQSIDTFVIESDKRDRVYRFVRKNIDEGRQVYIVCPLVEGGDSAGEIASVREYAREITNSSFKGYNIGLLYGGMSAQEKQQTMESFLRNEIQIMVSTTVIEVGVDIPNATVMIIENAERFGLCQIHQLRGRIGRGYHKSYCILISDSQAETTNKRLSIVASSDNGMEIAQKDLEIRGPGDFFGTRQHGVPLLASANFLSDMEVVGEVNSVALEILEADPDLSLPQHRCLRAMCHELYGGLLLG